MMLQEMLVSALIKTKLFEMAFSRKDAHQRVMGLSSPIFINLVMILVAPKDHVDYDHWIDNVDKLIEDIGTIRIDGKRIKQKWLYKWLVTEPDYDVKKTLKLLNKKYKKLELSNYDGLDQDVWKLLLKITKDISGGIYSDLRK